MMDFAYHLGFVIFSTNTATDMERMFILRLIVNIILLDICFIVTPSKLIKVTMLLLHFFKSEECIPTKYKRYLRHHKINVIAVTPFLVEIRNTQYTPICHIVRG